MARHEWRNARALYATHDSRHLDRAGSRRIGSMQFRPANIRLIHRRSSLLDVGSSRFSFPGTRPRTPLRS